MRKIVDIPETPPSFNKVGHTGSRWAWTKTKHWWQGLIEGYLLKAAIPRGNEKIAVTAILTFPTTRRRDVGNYRTILEKALGDALVNGRWIPDDTPEHFAFDRLVFASELGPHTTTLILEVEE